jgi:hypothetical protein
VSFRATRLGIGDWLVGLGGVLLLIDLLAVPWFVYRPEYQPLAIVLSRRVSMNGWQAFTVVGPLTLLVSLVGITIYWLAGTRRSPALPVVLTTLLTPVSLALVVLLAVRVLLDQPVVVLRRGAGNALEPRAGAYFALVLSIVILAGLYVSLRREGVAEEDAPREAETITLGRARSGVAP